VLSCESKIARLLRGRCDVRLVLLFGSRARGTDTAESDVDLAVWAPGVDLLDLAWRVSSALGLEVDVVSLEEPDIPMVEELVASAVVVHEGEPGAAGAWRARALSILELDGPWYARMRDAWLKRVAAGGFGPWSTPG
jgi:predicted nucleotidyltransferase